MNSVFDIAQSGLQVSSLRLEVSANNVANTLTSGFVPSHVEATDVAAGGATGDVIKENDPQFEAQIDRNIAGLSGTDLTREVVGQSETANAFKANLATLRTADDMLASLMEIKK